MLDASSAPAQNKPAAARSVGFQVFKKYALGLAAAVAWSATVSVAVVKDQYAIFQSQTAAQALAEIGVPETKAFELHPDPAWPAILNNPDPNDPTLRAEAIALSKQLRIHGRVAWALTKRNPLKQPFMRQAKNEPKTLSYADYKVMVQWAQQSASYRGTPWSHERLEAYCKKRVGREPDNFYSQEGQRYYRKVGKCTRRDRWDKPEKGMCYTAHNWWKPCSRQFRHLFKASFNAQSDEAHFAASYIGQTIGAYNAARAKYEQDLAEALHAREKTTKRLHAEIAVLNNTGLTPAQINALRFGLYGAGLVVLSLSLVCGGGLSLLARPRWFPRHSWAIGGVLVAGYFGSFWLIGEPSIRAMGSASLAFGVPFAFFAYAPLRAIFTEYIKEHPWYRAVFVHKGRGEKARLAGVRDFMIKDMSGYFARNRWSIEKNKTSDIYLGRTPMQDDIRLGGRDVGLVGTETHCWIISGTGGGKSRDIIWNTVLGRAGGMIAFDPAGEHVRVTFEKRAEYAPAYMLDPMGECADFRPSDSWEPLSEIDVDHPAARDQLRNVAEASIYPEAGGQNPHFQENGASIARGFISHVKTALPKEDQHLGSVYDLLVTGEPGGKYFNPKRWNKLLAEMATNDALGGAPRDAAGILSKVGDRELGSYLSTLQRGLDWINSPGVREIITKPSTFSVREAKSREASIYLVLPEAYITPQTRFLRTFYTLALDMCDNHITPQPEGSKRRVLFLFEEMEKLGAFKPIEDLLLRKRKSFLQAMLISQNYGQVMQHFQNVANFSGSCDKAFFGLDVTDVQALDLLAKACGQYTEGVYEGRADEPRYSEHMRQVFAQSELGEWLDAGGDGMIAIPIKGKPMKLRRVPYYKNFPAGSYGKHVF